MSARLSSDLSKEQQVSRPRFCFVPQSYKVPGTTPVPLSARETPSRTHSRRRPISEPILSRDTTSKGSQKEFALHSPGRVKHLVYCVLKSIIIISRAHCLCSRFVDVFCEPSKDPARPFFACPLASTPSFSTFQSLRAEARARAPCPQ